MSWPLRVTLVVCSLVVVVAATIIGYRELHPVPYDHVLFTPTAIANTVPGVVGPAVHLHEPLRLTINLENDTQRPAEISMTAAIRVLSPPIGRFDLLPETSTTQVYPSTPLLGTVRLGQGRIEFAIPPGITHNVVPIALPDSVVAAIVAQGSHATLELTGTVTQVHSHAKVRAWSTEPFQVVP